MRGEGSEVVKRTSDLLPLTSDPENERMPKMSQEQHTLRESVFSKLSEIIKSVSGIDTAHIDTDAHFLELGLDSLMLVRINQGIQKRFGVEISMLQFYEGANTINKITDYIAGSGVPFGFAQGSGSEVSSEGAEIGNQRTEVQSYTIPLTPNPERSRREPRTSVERIMFQQMQAMSQLMSQQLEILKRGAGSEVRGQRLQVAGERSEARTHLSPRTPHPAPANVNLRGIELGADALTSRQQNFLRSFIERYTARSKKSRELVQKYRPFFSDWINSLGFRLTLKEVMYPVVASRSQGSRFWDIDGNEYIDLAIGYGVSFFGNRPAFIVKAIEEQLREGFELGPQSQLAGEVAELICELTGVERVTFCNTGSEAVMTAIRIARGFTGRDKIVLFSGSYHGNSDGVLAAPGPDGTSVPAAPGTTQGAVQDVLILNYGVPESLEIIKSHAHELAAVLVEPVQSRRPGFQPKEFLHELRELTLKEKIVLIFDEMITGFRIHQGGAQAWFGVKADLVTYGKIVAGGMPIGVVAGKAQYMDIIDGGRWQFGDNSHPQAGMIFFAGTFCKHPLTMAAAKAALTHLKEQGPELQQLLNGRTADFVRTLNTFFEETNVAIRVTHFGPLFLFESHGKKIPQPIERDLFFYLLLEKGIYTWEKRVCFFSTAHTDEDIGYILEKIKETISEMRDGGFLIEDTGSGKHDSAVNPESYPINEAQKQLWFLSRLNENAIPAYIESLALKLSGPLKPELFRKAVQQVVDRHDALRTVFAADGETQIVLPSVPAGVPVIDFSHSSTLASDPISEWLAENSRRQMNLETGPLFHFALLKLGEERHILVANFHHTIADGYSLLTLLQDMCISYTSLCEGKNADPKPVPQYRDFMQWQEDYFQSEKCKNDETFWLNLFPNGLPILDFPTDYPRPNLFTFSGARYQILCDTDLYKQIRDLGRKRRCTPFMTMIAAYTALIHRITGSEEVLIGFPGAGRFFEGSEKMAGYCAHLVPFYSRLDFNQSFDDYLDFVRQTLLKAYQHQQYPFSRLIRKLNMPQDMSRGSAISFEFNLDRFTGFPEMPGLEIEQFDLHINYAKYDLILDVLEIGDELHLKFEYATDLFSDDRIKRLAGHYLTLLKEIAADSARPIGNLSLLTEAERQQILVEWNDTKRDIPKHKCFHELFEEQARQTPELTAAVFGAEKITYNDLNRRANRLARILTEQGVGTDFIVALLAERSIDFLTAMLGVFKAGGAYLPLDPLHPAQRISQILRESRTRLVLAEKAFLPLLSEARSQAGAWERGEESPRILMLGELLKQEASEENLPIRCTPNDLAYVIYTSGSTGVPKGAMVEHKGMLNHLYAKIFELDLSEKDVVAQNASQCFDISVWQFFSGLLVGGRTHICSDEVAHDPVLLLDQVVSKGITVLELVPSLLRLILDEINRSRNERPDLSGLRWLIPTGEALPPKLCAQWLRHYPNIPVLNAYGPTECSDDVAHYRISQPPEPQTANMPIGRPIINMQLYIIDSRLQPVPVGIAGELCVGGIGVGRGYLNNPEKTAESFISDPFSNEPGARLYKTGDLALYLPDGNIVFLGRVDHQVKVRGFRIELGEIEAVLHQHPAIRETVVMAREDHPGEQRIVAYVVPEPEKESLTIGDLRTYLSEKLPDYMIPSHFVTMKAFQLTPNGKIDRKALPKPEDTQADAESLYNPPRNALEKTLARVWEGVLRREKIGIRDNYFTLGGDSIKAIQIVSRLKEENLKLQLRDIFLFPAIEDLASRVTEIDRVIEQGPVTGSVPLTAIQSWFFRTHGKGKNHYNQAVILDSKQGIRENAARAALEKIQEHHDALRMTFDLGTSQTIAFNCSLDYPFSFDVLDFRARQDALSAYQVQADKLQASIDLENGPMMQSVLFRLPGSDRLLIVIHHLVMDGVSWQILLDDFTRGYEQYLSGKPIQLPLKTDSFKQWAEQIQLYSNSESLLKEKAYWESLDAVTVKPLPKDHETGENLYQDLTTADFSLSKEDTNRLIRNVNHAYHTNINDILLVSFARAMKQWHGESRTAIMLEGHGREHLFEDTDITRTVGWFTSEYPLILELPSDDTGVQIKTVKEMLRGIPNKGVGYGILKYLTTAEKASFQLRPQIAFNYLGQTDDEINDSLFELTDVSEEHSVSPGLTRSYDFETEGMVLRGQFRVIVYYNKQHYKPETVTAMLSYYNSELLKIIAHCEGKTSGELTPSDLTYPNLSLQELDELLESSGIEKKNLKDIYPLSPMQEGMLFHRLYQSESLAYFEQFSFAMSGDLNIKLFEDGWNELLRRYDILRTVFVYKGTARPLQVVLKERRIAFTFKDLRAMQEEAESYIEQFKQGDREKGFDLSRDVLTRLTVFQVGETTYKAVWSYHHILMDGWCLGILVRELLECYQSVKKGQSPTLKPAVQYSTYIRWLENADREASRQYWADYLAGYRQLATLPKTGDKTGGERELSKIVGSQLSENSTNQLQQLSAVQQVTVNTVLQSLWGILLSHYNGAEDVVFGVAVSGRPADISGVEEIVGLFLNTVPLRVQTHRSQRFDELVKKVQADALAGEPHHYYSLAEIQSASETKQDLLDHVFIFQNFPLSEELYNIRKEFKTDFSIDELDIFEQTGYDLSIEVNPGRQIGIDLRYNTLIFREELMKQISEQLIQLIEAVINKPGITVGEIKEALVSEKEEQEQAEFLNAAMTIDEDF